jgi:hypothetical protein
MSRRRGRSGPGARPSMRTTCSAGKRLFVRLTRPRRQGGWRRREARCHTRESCERVRWSPAPVARLLDHPDSDAFVLPILLLPMRAMMGTAKSLREWARHQRAEPLALRATVHDP